MSTEAERQYRKESPTQCEEVDKEHAAQQIRDALEDSASSSDSELSKQSTRSISRSQLEEHAENGRRYCSRTYYMPADETERDRLQVAHQAYLSVLDGNLSLAAIPRNAERILDVGTGTGDWAMAIADHFPETEITASDITASFQPSNAPANVYFEIDDANEPWEFLDLFDMIHMRGLVGAFADWGKIYEQAGKSLKRGGSLEVIEMGRIQVNGNPAGSKVRIFNEALETAAEKAGISLSLAHMQRKTFGTAGLSVVKTKIVQVRLGAWNTDPRRKLAGKMVLVTALEGLEAMSLRLLTRHANMGEGEVRLLCDDVKKEVMAEQFEGWVPIEFAVARKIL